MFKVVIALLCIVAVVNGAQFEICDSTKLANVVKFSVTDCAENAEECSFIVGKEYTFVLDISVTKEHPASTVLPYKVTGTFLGVPIVIAQGDACEFEGVTCPITPGTEITVSVTKTIPADAPNFSKAKVTARVWDETVKGLPEASACASIKVTVVKP